MSFYFTKLSKKDLKDIWHYTYKNWGEKQADNYLSAIRDACIELSKFPTIGRLFHGLDKEVRVYRYQKHYIFYIERKESIKIIAIIHEKMDIIKKIPWRI
jgi:toxin ParE1/3/4